MSTLEITNRQIVDSVRDQRMRAADRQRLLRPIHAVDALIADLEELHLAGRKRVPDAFLPRLRDLVATVPGGEAVEVRARVTIVHLMDQLYELQEGLLQTKSGMVVGELPEAS